MQEETPNLKELKEIVDRLHVLLDQPEAGLQTWLQAIAIDSRRFLKFYAAEPGDRLRRVLQANQLGIRFWHEDGRVVIQWLTRKENKAEDFVDFFRLYSRYGMKALPTLAYDLEGALTQVDIVLESIGMPKLADLFHGQIDGEQNWGLHS